MFYNKNNIKILELIALFLLSLPVLIFNMSIVCNDMR